MFAVKIRECIRWSSKSAEVGGDYFQQMSRVTFYLLMRRVLGIIRGRNWWANNG